MRINVEIVNKAEFKNILRNLPNLLLRIAFDLVDDIDDKLADKAQFHAPFGVTGDLRRSIRPERRPTHRAGIVYSKVESTVSYARYVHDGGIPIPRSSFAGSGLENLRRWREKKGVRKPLTSLVEQLTREGVRRPTPFFLFAVNNLKDSEIDRIFTQSALKHTRRIARRL